MREQLNSKELACLRPLKDEDMDRYGGSYPSLRDMVKLLHITDCALAQAVWQDQWAFCPVCGGQRGEDGAPRHLSRAQ